MNPTEWPKLSETLGDVSSWGECQSCQGGSLFGDLEGLEIYREHDEVDRGTAVAIAICRRCADRIIEPHPRLYSKELPNAPLPGLMELCRECPSRVGYRCTHPDLRANGGPGLELHFPKPTRAHVNRGRGRSGWETWWNGPPSKCAGR